LGATHTAYAQYDKAEQTLPGANFAGNCCSYSISIATLKGGKYLKGYNVLKTKADN